MANLSSIGGVLNYFHVVIKYLGSNLKEKGYPLCPGWGECDGRAGAATAMAQQSALLAHSLKNLEQENFHTQGAFSLPLLFSSGSLPVEWCYLLVHAIWKPKDVSDLWSVVSHTFNPSTKAETG